MYSKLIHSYIYILVALYSRSFKSPEVWFEVFIVLERCYLQVFARVSIHCTGYPRSRTRWRLTCKSHYMHWLVSQGSYVSTFLLLECVAAPVRAQLQVQVQVQVWGAGSSAGVPSTPSAISAFSSFSSENTESDTEAVLDFVWLTRSFETSLTESCRTEFFHQYM